MVITGVIRPPPEIRAGADRTASYVAKNGRAFEARILTSAKGKTPKFAFLQPTSPFHAYYEDRIQFYGDGGEDNAGTGTEEKKTEQQQPAEADADSSKKENDDKKSTTAAAKTSKTTTTPKETVRKKEKTQKASAINPIAKALLAQRAKITQAKAKKEKESEQTEGEQQQQLQQMVLLPLPPPPPLELVTIVAPSTLSASQIETIQLVAQFAALDGKGGPFLHQLTLREWTNSDFSFCQPRHAHFAYFSALVDAYRRILGLWTASASIKSNGVPIINDADDDAQFALEEAAYRAEYEREMDLRKSQQEDGEVVAIDWQDFVVVETIDFPVDEKVELSMLPPPPPLPSSQKAAQQSSNGNAAAASNNSSEQAAAAMDDDDDSDDDEEEETIRVVPSYTPKVVGPSNPQQARAIDPITGKSVSVADMPEHMRIQLLDPKWAEERKKFQEKQGGSNLVGGDAIVNNISRFAQARGDLFGKSVRYLYTTSFL
jgi:splicing factor 3A subunit 1